MAVSRSIASSRRWRGSDSNDSTKVPLPSMVPPIMTFSSTDAEPTMRGVWNVRAIRICARRWRREHRQCGAVQPDRAALLRVVAGDDVQRRGLAAAVGTDQSMHLTRPDLEIESVDRMHAAEAQRHLFQRQARRHRAARRAGGASRSGRGTIARSLSSGRRFLKSRISAIPPGIASTMTSSSTA